MSKVHLAPLPSSGFCRRGDTGRTVQVLELSVSSARDLHGGTPLTTPVLVA